jgi:cytidylate kinase
VSIAIGRQAGTPVAAVEAALMRQLNPEGKPPAWTLFDETLVRQVLADHHLPEVLARAMPEDRAPRVDEFWREFLGGQPPQWELVEKTNDTIYRLAKRGGAVLVGRGAPWLTRSLTHVVKVSLTGSIARRSMRLAEEEGGDQVRARGEILRRDEGVARYLTAHFGQSALEQGVFDVVVQTDDFSPEAVASIIVTAVRDRELRADAAP